MQTLSPTRFAAGFTFDQYVQFVSSSENLRREGPGGAPRRDFGDFLRSAYETTSLTASQIEALRWLGSQPNGPKNVLVLSEEWSSDCRRDVPALAKMADVAGWHLRIFTRDGQTCATGPKPDPESQPNADLVAQFLLHKNGQTYQSLPVAAFYTDDFEYLYHYVESPSCYGRDAMVAAIRGPRPGELPDEAKKRGDQDWWEFQQTPFFRVLGCAAADEIITKLHERLVTGKSVV